MMPAGRGRAGLVVGPVRELASPAAAELMTGQASQGKGVPVLANVKPAIDKLKRLTAADQAPAYQPQQLPRMGSGPGSGSVEFSQQGRPLGGIGRADDGMGLSLAW